MAVEGEFEVKLGITSDNLFAPWYVYKTKLFLRDPEEPGKPIKPTGIKRDTIVSLLEQELIHPLQVNEHLCKPIVCIYSFLDANINKLYPKLVE